MNTRYNFNIKSLKKHQSEVESLNVLHSRDNTVRIKKKVIHFQWSIVLKSINLNICMWHTSKEQLIFFPLVPFLHHVCHAWPSTLPLKMTMSCPTFCKFCESDKSLIAKQCNGVAAEIATSHARWSFPFWIFEWQGACNFSLLSWGLRSGIFDMN